MAEVSEGSSDRPPGGAAGPDQPESDPDNRSEVAADPAVAVTAPMAPRPTGGLASTVLSPADASTDLQFTPDGVGVTVPSRGRARAASVLPIRADSRYRRGREIARGGMGRIIAATDEELGRRITIKELLAPGGRLERRFAREIRITARLEHPAIIAVHEAGCWPDGTPFYTMKHVEGRAFDKVIEQAGEYEDRIQLLPHVLAVADALAYAHTERVIHRDLKPANVLIGGFGETVVIDWGLAKDLAHESGDEGEGDSTLSGDGDVTVAGEAMGTPAYMAPEQARGEPVDERTDVYALGAMLYHLLAGHMPYLDAEPRDGAQLVGMVRGGPPTALGELAPEVPPDLLAIVDKAMARLPERRYPTAKELAGDLRKFTTGQLVGAHEYTLWQLVRRWLGRHRAAVGVAAVMAVVLIAGGVFGFVRITRERDRAAHQQAVAEQNREQVEGLLDFMLGDLQDKLAPIGQVGLLDLVASRASSYFASRAIDWGRPDAAFNRARAHLNLGVVRQVKGDLEAALGDYRESEEISSRLVELYPERLDYQTLLAEAYARQGAVAQARGDLAAALERYRAARDLRARLVDTNPGQLGWQADLSRDRQAVGDLLLEKGDVDGALAEYRAAQAICEQLARADPDDPTRQQALATMHARVAEVRSVRGDLDSAISEYRVGAAILERLATASPEIRQWRRDLATMHARIGSILAERGDLDGALAEFRIDKAITERLAAFDPANPQWQRDLSVSHNKVGALYAASGDGERALAEFQAARVIRERLVALDPSNARWRRDLSVSYDNIASVLANRGDHRAALAQFRASEAIAAELAKRDPDNVDWQLDLATSHLNVSFALTDSGEPKQASVELRAAEEILTRLIERSPDQSAPHVLLGEVLMASGRLAGAASDRKAARAHFLRAAGLFEQHAHSGVDLAGAGCSYAAGGDAERALALLGRAVDDGWRDSKPEESCPELATLRRDPRWKALRERVTAN